MDPASPGLLGSVFWLLESNGLLPDDNPSSSMSVGRRMADGWRECCVCGATFRMDGCWVRRDTTETSGVSNTMKSVGSDRAILLRCRRRQQVGGVRASAVRTVASW